MNLYLEKTHTGRDAAAPRPRTLRFECLEARLLLSVSAEEQQFVYLLNLARHDPVAYQREVGLAVDLSGIAARPPLAVHECLMQSAGLRSDEMAQHDYFGHLSPVTGDWPNKVARDQGYDLPSGWADDENYIESISAGDWYDQAAAPLHALIVDQGRSTAGHRRHLLGVDAFYAENREIGVGYAADPASSYGRYWTVHIARRDPAEVFVTGVVFDDGDGDGRYDPGEGLPGVTLQAGDFSATTNDAGGFSLAVAPNRWYRIHASEPGSAVLATGNVLVGDANVEVDIRSGISGAFVNFANQPTSAWTNPQDRLDVSANRDVEPLDALQIINHLNATGPGQPALPAALAEPQPPFLDTDGDALVLPRDALLVINGLNRTPGGGEGESLTPGGGMWSTWPDRPATGSPAKDAAGTETLVRFVAQRPDVHPVPLPVAVLPSPPREAAAEVAAKRRCVLHRAESETTDEALAAWGAKADLLSRP